MRLIQVSGDQQWSMTADLPAAPGPYAVLSHTWGADEEEVTFKDVQDGSGTYKPGSTKLSFCANQAVNDGLAYFWIDTCCIDKTNHVELSEAITSMFRWYRQAEKCYVYLSDVSTNSEDVKNSRDQWESAFRNSRWFHRGWTLQELLAPTHVEFFSRERRRLGDKTTLEALICDITRIPVGALRGQPLSHFTVDERFQWTRGRSTRKVEDRAYCLLGIFGVSMSLRYGEGEDALARLEKKVRRPSKSIDDADLVNWLAPSRSRELHAKTSGSRLPQTGTSFIEGPLMSWLHAGSDHSSLMWITGKSGIGKTTLFSHVVDITETFVSERPTTAFAYHYCTFSDPESQRLINILGSLVLQISVRQPSILDGIKTVFERDRERKQVKTLQVWELEQVFIRYGARLDTVILLLDALNESEDFFETFACIERILQQLPGLKILTTSTRNAPISDSSGTIHLRRIQMDPLDDIQAFVDFQLRSHITLRCLSTECRETIRTTLVEKADQSFRWVSLVLERLGRERTESAVLKALTEVPQGLHHTYAKMLDVIPVADRAIAREALLWVCFAKRPVTLLELSEAVILESCRGTLAASARLIRPAIILEICEGFLDYEHGSGRVKLAHASVKDYLLSQHIRDHGDAFFSLAVDLGNQTITNRCLTYLMLDNFRTVPRLDTSDLTTLTREFPLLVYAAHYWALHASYATQSEWRLARRLFATRTLPHGGNYGVWGGCMMPGWDRRTIVETEPLYYAAAHDLYPLLQVLLSGDLLLERIGVDVEYPGGRFGSTALQMACFRGRKRSAQCLVAAGADFWTDDKGSYQPAWFWAMCNGWDDVVSDMMKRKPKLVRRMEKAQYRVSSGQRWMMAERELAKRRSQS